MRQPPRRKTVYLDSGTNPIGSQEEWDNYTPPPGFLENTPRHAEFNDEQTLSSHGLPQGLITDQWGNRYIQYIMGTTAVANDADIPGRRAR
jgi:hypothetical protein